MNTQIYLKLILTCSMLQGGILLSAPTIRFHYPTL